MAHYTHNDQLVDGRNRGFFWVEDALFDEHAPEIGVYGVAVYCLLARLADGGGNSFPSFSTIAKTLKISRRKAQEVVNDLVTRGLLVKAQRYQEDSSGRQTSNLFTLQQLSQRDAHGAHPPVHRVHGSGASGAPHIRNTHIRNTQEKEEETPNRGKDIQYYDVDFLNEEHARIVSVLEEIPEWPRSRNATIDIAAKAMKRFPDVDSLPVARSLLFKIETGAYNCKDPSIAFSKWVSATDERQRKQEEEKRPCDREPIIVDTL